MEDALRAMNIGWNMFAEKVCWIKGEMTDLLEPNGLIEERRATNFQEVSVLEETGKAGLEVYNYHYYGWKHVLDTSTRFVRAKCEKTYWHYFESSTSTFEPNQRTMCSSLLWPNLSSVESREYCEMSKSDYTSRTNPQLPACIDSSRVSRTSRAPSSSRSPSCSRSSRISSWDKFVIETSRVSTLNRWCLWWSNSLY